MTLPNVNVTIDEFGLGAVQAQESDIVVVMGCASSGTSLLVSQTYTRVSTLQGDYGTGPGVEAAAYYINAGVPTIFIRLPSDTPGAAGTVTHVGTGASVLTITGTPLDDNEVVVLWDEDGTVGTDHPRFRYSLDSGIQYSAAVRIATNGQYVIPDTGIQLNFSASTVKKGDTYTFATTKPLWANSDVTSAFGALLAKNQLLWRLVHLVGPTDVTAAGVVDTAVQSMAADPNFRYTHVICDSAGFGMSSESAWMAALEAAFASFASDVGRVAIAAGPVRIAGALSTGGETGWRRVRSVGWLAVRRAMQVTIHTDISVLQPLEGISDITGFTVVYHDEQVLQGLDAARFITMRTIAGRVGYFITNPNLMAPTGSDFTLLQLGLVADVACATVRQYFLGALNTAVRLEIGTTHIAEKDRQTLEVGAQRAMFNALVARGHCTATQTQVANDDDLTVPPRQLTVSEFVVPLGYVKFIQINFAFKANITP
jgi:hypothetical protein